VVGVDQGAQFVGAAFELCIVERPYGYLRCSGRDYPSVTHF
jgi:hypothetical protein